MNICGNCKQTAKNGISVAEKILIKIWNEMFNENRPTELRYTFCEKCYDNIIRYKEIKSKIRFKNKSNYKLSENQCGMCLTAGLTTGRLMQESEVQFLRETFHLAVTIDDRIYICIECLNLYIEVETRRMKDDDSSPPLDSNPSTPRDVSTQPRRSAIRYFKNKRSSLYVKSLLNRQKKEMFKKRKS